MRRFINTKLLWIAPLILISCAHTPTREGYTKMLNSIFAQPNYEVEQQAADLGNHGFVIEGVLENMPYNLLALFEYTPENLILIDTVRTDSLGNFRLQKVLGDEQICYIQFGEQLGFPTALNNASKMNLKVRVTQAGVSYSMEGSNIESAKNIKKLTELNSGYLYKLNVLQRQAYGYEPTSTPQQMEMAQVQMVQLEQQRTTAIIQEMSTQTPSVAPFFVVKYLLQDPDYAVLKQAHEITKKYNEKLAYSQILKSWSEVEEITAIGSLAPEIKQKTPQGNMLSLSSLKGKVVLIDFWASWCRPCMAAMPEVTAIYEKFKDRGFTVYGVSLDRDSTSWANTINYQKLNWLHVSDIQGWGNAGAKAYNVHGIPATFLIDQHGKIAGKNLHGAALELKIEELLAKGKN